MRHIGFILDGNRTWAKKRYLPALEGHRRGYENMDAILDLCRKEKIQHVSLWALSDRNIRERSEEEVGYLFRLLETGIPRMVEKAIKNNTSLHIVGDLSLLPDSCRKACEEASEKTKSATEFSCTIAIGYGGQNEIIRAVKLCLAQGVDPSRLDETSFLQFLDTGFLPPPDMIVRTGGHSRHSGFFLYQSEYSEYYFTETLWPDFGEEDFYKALNSYSKAERKFGK